MTATLTFDALRRRRPAPAPASRWPGLSPLPSADGLGRDDADGETMTFSLLSTEALSDLRAALTTGSGPGGGYLVASTMPDAIEIALAQRSIIRQLASIVRTEKGGPYHWPGIEDASTEGEIVASSAQRSAGDLAFAKLVLDARKFNSKRVIVPAEWVEDASPSWQVALGAALGQRVAAIQNRAFTLTLTTSAGAGVAAASATVFSWDELLGLALSVDPAYRDAPGAGFMMSDVTALAVLKLKDGGGRNMQLANDSGRGSLMLHRWPVHVNNHMPAAAASARPVLFGDFSDFRIRDVGEAQMRIYMESDGLIEEDQRAVEVVLRSDGGLQHSGAVRALQMAAS